MIFFVESFLSHSTKKLHRRTLLCFRIFPALESFMDNRVGGGGLSGFFVRIFSSHSAKKFPSGAILCCVSENFR